MKVVLALVLLATVPAALAGRLDAVREQAEMSLLATGQIVIDGEGKVSTYALDRPGELPPVVAKVLDKAITRWRFEPVLVDGEPVRAKTAMSVRIGARKNDAGGYDARIVSANFQVELPEEERVTRVKIFRPKYPHSAARAGLSGTVYVVLRVGPDGKVQEAVVEQVNLRTVDTERAMPQWRDLLAKSALEAVRRWTFQPPTRGEEVHQPFWSVRVPMDYVMAGRPTPEYGQWDVYIPGPRQLAPWSDENDAGLGADAIAGDGIHQAGTGPRLLTPLAGS